MKRKIIDINEELCNGCGNCIPNCAEGALQIIDGKARLISDLFCDGLGACIGHCPTGAMQVVDKEAEPYDEKKVMVNVVKGGENVIKAHLQHMLDHDEAEYFNQAVEYLEENNIDNPLKGEKMEHNHSHSGGCPGSKTMQFNRNESNSQHNHGKIESELQQWPVQMHLLNPTAPYFRKADVLLAADCTAYTIGDFHRNFLKGKTLAIACPKLDTGLDIYVDKIRRMIDEAEINTLTVMIMEVPCCMGLIQIAQKAVAEAERKVPVKKIVISLQGEVLTEEWI